MRCDRSVGVGLLLPDSSELPALLEVRRDPTPVLGRDVEQPEALKLTSAASLICRVWADDARSPMQIVIERTLPCDCVRP